MYETVGGSGDDGSGGVEITNTTATVVPAIAIGTPGQGPGCLTTMSLGGSCEEPDPDPGPPVTPPPPSCEIDLDYRGLLGGKVPPILKLGIEHLYLAVISATGSYVQEGYPIAQRLDAVTTANGIDDDPSNQTTNGSFGHVAGTFVCGWLPILNSAANRVKGANAVFNELGPNSSTALYYMLSQLPTTISQWFKFPVISVLDSIVFGLPVGVTVYPIGWNAYPF